MTKIDLDDFDKFAGLRDALSTIAKDRGEWAGIPMPLAGQNLTVEPTYPNAQALMAMCREDEEPSAGDPNFHLRNSFYSNRHHCEIAVYDEGQGAKHLKLRSTNRAFGFLLNTLDSSRAWGIKQEAEAMCTLAELLPHHHFKQYMLTGMWLETSQRSGITYLFGKLRPTLAISKKFERPKILAALCLHPIAYYEQTWAGAMCPTDDILAHLMLMRGDEKMFWRRANQHPAWHMEAGL